jgi:zinc transport system substrate-binding protein
MQKKALFLILLGAAAWLIVYGIQLQSTNPGISAGKLSVAASFYPLYFFAQEIGGVDVQVSNITPAGAEPHEYEPTAQDIARIYESDVLIVNGGGFEPWFDRVRDSLSPDTRIVLAGEAVILKDVSGSADPHVWLSPPLASAMVSQIEQGFVAARPAEAEAYAERAAMLRQKLAMLDSKFKEGLAQCTSKTIVTSHAAFGYLASAYGLTQVSVTGISPEAEPSLQALASIARFVKEQGIKYIFFETLVSPKLAETLAHETGAQTLVLNPLEGLLPEEIAEGKTYFTEMEHNLAQLALALNCTQ